MAFADPDPIEEDWGIRCSDMNPTELAGYIQTYQDQLNKIKIIVTGMEQRSIRQLQETYGPEVAGQIVKWTYWKHRGFWDNEPVLPQSFSRGRKWWTDKMYAEVQLQLARDERKAKYRENPYAGFATDL